MSTILYSRGGYVCSMLIVRVYASAILVVKKHYELNYRTVTSLLGDVIGTDETLKTAEYNVFHVI